MRRAPVRAGILIAGLLVAGVCFGLLSSESATSKIGVTRTVQKNFRAAYDILVRPRHARRPLEARDHLVSDDFLSGLFGGITLKQYRKIASLPGVSVAAPVANVGYFLVQSTVFVPFRGLPTPKAGTVYRAKVNWNVHGGLARYPGATAYTYYTPSELTVRNVQAGYETTPGGKSANVCSGFGAIVPHLNGSLFQESVVVTDPYKAALEPTFACASPRIRLIGTARSLGRDRLVSDAAITPHGQPGAFVTFSLPVLVAGVDPDAEQQLVGLRGAMTSGSYLKEGAGLTAPHRTLGSVDVRNYPVIASTKTFLDQSAQVTVQQLRPRHGQSLTALLSGSNTRSALPHVPGKTIAHYAVHPTIAWQRDLSRFNSPLAVGLASNYWRISPTTDAVHGHTITPKVVANQGKVWSDASPTGESHGNSLAPPGSNDVWYRRLRAFGASGQFHRVDGKQTYVKPRPTLMGTFNPFRLKDFSQLSRVPLQTFFPPHATAGDSKTRRLLGGKPLGPTTNLGGYLSQPPLLLTTIGGAVALDNGDGEDYTVHYTYRGAHGATEHGSQLIQAYQGASPRAPISTIQVRVKGVTGPNTISLARIKAVAEQIYDDTGLTVDITAGSSPTPITVKLAKGKFGTPPLTLHQGWVKEDVDSAIINALDNKNLALFIVLALSCCLFAAGVLQANVRQRHHELAVLVTLGWPARLIATLVATEVAGSALLAGLLSTGLVIAIASASGLTIPTARLILITPVVFVLGLLTVTIPARRAAATQPLDALRGQTRSPALKHRIRTLRQLAINNLRRAPARNGLAAVTLALAVASATFVLGIQQAFHGSVASTVLGSTVVVDVHSTDVITALLVLALGAGAVSDVLYAAFLERRTEIGLLQAFGWNRRTLIGLMLREGLAIAGTGAITGALLATVAVVMVGVSTTTAIAEGAIGAIIGIAIAVAATLVPIALTIQRAPLQALSATE